MCEFFTWFVVEQQSTPLVSGLIETVDRVMEHMVTNLEPSPRAPISVGGTTFVAGQKGVSSQKWTKTPCLCCFCFLFTTFPFVCMINLLPLPNTHFEEWTLLLVSWLVFHKCSHCSNRLLSDEILTELQPASLPLPHTRQELHLCAWGGLHHAV